jgi:pimeloyl-ACP methyl ester carboxylesterase
MPSENPAKPPVVFIHGLWLHAESWQAWIDLFGENGYQACAVNWPGDGKNTQATRQNPQAVGGFGVKAIANHIARQIEPLGTRVILIGHSFGGLMVQNLLGRGLCAAGIAISPAPIKGVPELPLTTLRSFFPILINPFNIRRAVSLSERQFRYIFASAITEPESRQLFRTYAMPAPARPLFQTGAAIFNTTAETKVVVTNGNRGPLLLISGEADHAVPPVLVRSTLRVYRKSMAVTEFKLFAGRGHSLTIDDGWKDVATFCLAWLRAQGM